MVRGGYGAKGGEDNDRRGERRSVREDGGREDEQRKKQCSEERNGVETPADRGSRKYFAITTQSDMIGQAKNNHPCSCSQSLVSSSQSPSCRYSQHSSRTAAPWCRCNSLSTREGV